MLKGSCHCGAIQYEIHGELGPIVCCHCSQCRKSQGSAFATNSPIESVSFRLVAGEDALAKYPTSAEKIRAFCKYCGSPIYSQLIDKPEIMRLRIGSLDTKIDVKPTAHIYVGSKAEWYDINDDLPKYERLEPR